MMIIKGFDHYLSIGLLNGCYGAIQVRKLGSELAFKNALEKHDRYNHFIQCNVNKDHIIILIKNLKYYNAL